MDYTSLGRAIRKQRKAQHLTQGELADGADISLSFLGHIERGSRKASMDTLVKISNTLGTTPDALLYADIDSMKEHTRPPRVAAVDLEKLRDGIEQAILNSVEMY